MLNSQTHFAVGVKNYLQIASDINVMKHEGIWAAVLSHHYLLKQFPFDELWKRPFFNVRIRGKNGVREEHLFFHIYMSNYVCKRYFTWWCIVILPCIIFTLIYMLMIWCRLFWVYQPQFSPFIISYFYFSLGMINTKRMYTWYELNNFTWPIFAFVHITYVHFF